MSALGFGIGILVFIMIMFFVLGSGLRAFNRKKSRNARYSQQDIIDNDAGAGSADDETVDGPG